MYDVNEFVKLAHSGQICDGEEILHYISSFSKIILWGAGNLGTELGQYLLSRGVKINAFWDKKYQSVKFCNGISVEEPFTDIEEKSKVLLIPCIVNGSLGNEWTKKELKKNGYVNYLDGMALYEGLVCPLNSSHFDVRECTRRKACSLCNCQRYVNLLGASFQKQNALTFQLITFVISTRCTLRCKYCGQRLSEYTEKDKIDFDFKDIIRDIDSFLSAVDFVGMISIIGGEPFVHPRLPDIVEYCLTKDNFGVVNITTNGVVHISREVLSRLKNERVKVSFSIYDTYLTEAQKQLLKDNIDLVKESGISYSLSHPLWVKPGELKDYGYDREYMVKKKKTCSAIDMTAAVIGGVFYPCTIAQNIEGLHKFSAGNALVDVRQREGLRERLRRCLSQESFDACRYCGQGSSGSIEIPAGEQV